MELLNALICVAIFPPQPTAPLLEGGAPRWSGVRNAPEVHVGSVTFPTDPDLPVRRGPFTEVVHPEAVSFHSGRESSIAAMPLQRYTPGKWSEVRVELYIFDKGYVDRLREGDPSTEQHFVSYFGQLLGIMLRARMLPPERVDDVRQETFIRVISTLRRDGGIRQPERFGAFVNSVCKNVLRENSREQYKNRPLEQGQLDLPDTHFDLQGYLISEETKARVREVLGELNPSDRDLLRAVFLEEGDRDEICRRLGLDRDYLRVRVHRAKERFRTLFQKHLALPQRAAAKESS